MSWHRVVVGAVLAGVMLALWFAVTALGIVPRLIVPAPGATWTALVQIIKSGHDLREAILTTVATIGAGFGCAVLAGVPAGIAIGRSPVLTAAYEPVIASLTAVPVIVLYPMLAGALGVTPLPKTVIAFISAVLPILLASVSAARHVEPRLEMAMRSLGAGRLKAALSVTLPAALPPIFTGLRTGLGLCAVTVVAAEYIASLNGLGYRLAEASQALQTPSLYAWVLVTLVVMAALNVCLRTIQLIADKGVKR